MVPKTPISKKLLLKPVWSVLYDVIDPFDSPDNLDSLRPGVEWFPFAPSDLIVRMCRSHQLTLFIITSLGNKPPPKKNSQF